MGRTCPIPPGGAWPPLGLLAQRYVVAPARFPDPSSETIKRIVDMMARLPVLLAIRANPRAASLSLTFALALRLDARAARELGSAIAQHVRAFHRLGGDRVQRVTTRTEREENVTFLHVTRDLVSVSAEELALLVRLLRERFGERLIVQADGQPAADEAPDEVEASVEAVLEALRSPARRQRVVGVRDEEHVLVYVIHSNQRAKVRTRSKSNA